MNLPRVNRVDIINHEKYEQLIIRKWNAKYWSSYDNLTVIFVKLYNLRKLKLYMLFKRPGIKIPGSVKFNFI